MKGRIQSKAENATFGLLGNKPDFKTTGFGAAAYSLYVSDLSMQLPTASRHPLPNAKYGLRILALAATDGATCVVKR